MVYGIITLLKEDLCPDIYNLVENLSTDCNLPEKKITPVPHFSWHVADRYDQPTLEQALIFLTNETQPFPGRASGLGIFSAPEPVIYIPVFKDAELVNFQRQLWDKVTRLAEKPNQFYHPDNWVPHITLTFGALIPEELCCVISKLAYQSIELSFQIDQLSLGFLADEITWGISGEYLFDGS